MARFTPRGMFTAVNAKPEIARMPGIQAVYIGLRRLPLFTLCIHSNS